MADKLFYSINPLTAQSYLIRISTLAQMYAFVLNCLGDLLPAAALVQLKAERGKPDLELQLRNFIGW